MYISTPDNRPKRVPQRMLSPEAIQRMAKIARRRKFDKNALLHIIFNQGAGRKSLQAILNNV